MNLVALGVADVARGYCKDLDLFEMYWLDALVIDPEARKLEGDDDGSDL